MKEQIKFIMQINKEVNMYVNFFAKTADAIISDMANLIFGSAHLMFSFKCLVRSTLLRILNSGEFEFSIKTIVGDALMRLIESIDMNLPIDIIEDHILKILSVDLNLKVELSVKDTSNLMICLFEKIDLPLATELLSNISSIKIQENSEILNIVQVDSGPNKTSTVLSDDIHINFSVDALDYLTILSSCSNMQEIKMSSGTTLVSFYRTVDDCAAFTINGLGSMTLNDLFISEIF